MEAMGSVGGDEGAGRGGWEALEVEDRQSAIGDRQDGGSGEGLVDGPARGDGGVGRGRWEAWEVEDRQSAIGDRQDEGSGEGLVDGAAGRAAG
jgi:hypothetical protein